jgi:hypothetical protein
MLVQTSIECTAPFQRAEQFPSSPSSPRADYPFSKAPPKPVRAQQKCGYLEAVISSCILSSAHLLYFWCYCNHSTMTSLSPEDEAIRIICADNFHQSLWLPETANHPKLKVTYSTTTNFDDLSLPVVLFVGPIFSTRWFSLHFDKLARECGLKVICVDRYV